MLVYDYHSLYRLSQCFVLLSQCFVLLSQCFVRLRQRFVFFAIGLFTKYYLCFRLAKALFECDKALFILDKPYFIYLFLNFILEMALYCAEFASSIVNK
jgi:hypothetical protein